LAFSLALGKRVSGKQDEKWLSNWPRVNRLNGQIDRARGEPMGLRRGIQEGKKGVLFIRAVYIPPLFDASCKVDIHEN
jgi:hypothetical protein